MILDTLITNRTQADVEQVAEWISRGWDNLSSAEKTEWNRGMRGSYNAADFRRVMQAMAYVSGRLAAAGVDTIRLNAPADWESTQLPTESQLMSYLDDVAAIRDALGRMDTLPDTPSTMRGLTCREANDIERIILAVDGYITKMMAVLYYSGDLYSGEI